MSKIWIFLAILFLLFPSLAYANGAGLPPFFKINHQYSIANPLQTFGITASSFLIPQDFTKENYVVNQSIDFFIDQNQLETVIPKTLLQKTTYDWDFGDGIKTSGLENSHTYTAIGSYLLMLTINVYETSYDQPPTQFIDSFLLHILPQNSSYHLPKAVIKINNQQPVDPLKKRLRVDFNKPILFDASESLTKSSQIIAYLWNFGDGQTSTQASISHTYASQFTKTVVLRVKDANGFIDDIFVGLDATKDINKRIENNLFSQWHVVLFLFILMILAFVISKAKLTKPPKNKAT